ncbi:biotin/lipoyl-containing protein, partial [Nocardia abscessus]
MEDRPGPSASVLEFRLPDLGEGLTDAELVSWAVAVGDTVELNQTIADVETAKAVVSLPSPFAGRVVELLAQPGDTVAVGAPLIRVERESSRASVLVGYGPEEEAASRRRRSPEARSHTDAQPGEADLEPHEQEPPGPALEATRPAATPAARKLARELGIDLWFVAGSGPGGAVTVDDVRGAVPVSQPRPASPAAAPAAAG